MRITIMASHGTSSEEEAAAGNLVALQNIVINLDSSGILSQEQEPEVDIEDGKVNFLDFLASNMPSSKASRIFPYFFSALPLLSFLNSNVKDQKIGILRYEKQPELLYF